MEKALPLCWEHKVKLITNMGSANPQAAAAKCVEIARKHGLTGMKIACVTGPHSSRWPMMVPLPSLSQSSSDQPNSWMAGAMKMAGSATRPVITTSAPCSRAFRMDLL